MGSGDINPMQSLDQALGDHKGVNKEVLYPQLAQEYYATCGEDPDVQPQWVNMRLRSSIDSYVASSMVLDALGGARPMNDIPATYSLFLDGGKNCPDGSPTKERIYWDKHISNRRDDLARVSTSEELLPIATQSFVPTIDLYDVLQEWHNALNNLVIALNYARTSSRGIYDQHEWRDNFLDKIENHERYVPLAYDEADVSALIEKKGVIMERENPMYELAKFFLKYNGEEQLVNRLRDFNQNWKNIRALTYLAAAQPEEISDTRRSIITMALEFIRRNQWENAKDNDPSVDYSNTPLVNNIVFLLSFQESMPNIERKLLAVLEKLYGLKPTEQALVAHIEVEVVSQLVRGILQLHDKSKRQFSTVAI